jgi:hypothetical protein
MLSSLLVIFSVGIFVDRSGQEDIQNPTAVIPTV